MKQITLLVSLFLLLTACETSSGFKKPEFKMPFSKCPPQDEKSLKDILCRE